MNTLPLPSTASPVADDTVPTAAVTGEATSVASALAEAGISCNVIAGYFHDHLFVAYRDGAPAVEVLRRLSAEERA